MITRLTSLFALMFLCNLAYSQLAITEISYNPPESGTDSLEYIEVANTTNSPINVKDYKFTKGITYTFPDTIIGAGKHFLLVKNARSFKAVYNITAADWSPTEPLSTTNTLSNPGEIVELQDNNLKVLVSFKYEAIAPWPTKTEGTDGNGKSIELCMLTSDPSLGGNWKASVKDLLFMHNGKEVFGTPGAPNSITVCIIVPDTIVEVSSFKFTPKDLVIKVGETVRWKNIGGSHNVNGKVETFPSNPESFFSGPAAAGWEYDYTFTKPGLYNYQCDPHSSQMKGTVTVLDPNPPVNYPTRTILSVSSVNTNGIVDSLGKNCAITGVVYGVNLRPAGLQFTLIDNNNNGIGIFNGNTNFSYTVTEGDNVTVQGVVAQFNGFTQVTAANVVKNSGSNSLVTPKNVTTYAENDESSLVAIGFVKFKDPSQWVSAGSGFNVTMVDAQQKEFVVRIDNDIDAFLLPIPNPSQTYAVTGLLGQFDSSEPYTEGYQLLPRFIVDFSPAGSTSNEDLMINLMPNPVSDILEIRSIKQIDKVKIIDINGRIIQTLGQVSSIDMSNMINGAYIIQLTAGDKIVNRRVWKM